jgi:hypothetical protein
MFWGAVAAAGSGLLLGLWVRVPAVIAVSAAIVVACIIVFLLGNWSLLTALLFGFGLSTVLQLGYVAGVALSCARSRVASWYGILRAAVGGRS